ncbi:MAG: hypothetical protein FJX47_15050 [Alphaproteobacteria bacterium]|nr:hypothetical protein [Alphaproteobacteria bacterium]
MSDVFRRRAEAALQRGLPEWVRGLDIVLDDAAPGFARLRLSPRADLLLDKGTVSGTVILALADAALRAAIAAGAENRPFTAAGQAANFLAAPSGDADLWAEAQVLKAGSMLIVGETTLWSEGEQRIAAHVVHTFAWTVKPPSARKPRRERPRSPRRRS